MNEDDLLPYVIRRYEQELTRHENINTKASSQIGFVGVIIAIFGFLIGDSLATNPFLIILIVGLSILLVSIIVSILVLFPKHRIPALKVDKYLSDLRKGISLTPLIDIYSVHARKLSDYNFEKSKLIKIALILMLLGLIISFIGVTLSMMVLSEENDDVEKYTDYLDEAYHEDEEKENESNSEEESD